MCHRLCEFLQKYNILYDFQFGFRKNHSTILALIEVVDTIYENLDNHEYGIGVYLDLQKAFDTVNHEILLYKLNNCGVRGNVHQWFRSYLTNRQQFTCIGNTFSDLGYIRTGVPQGSVLGPLLFLLYINDICYAVPGTKIKLFADDTNLFIFHKNPQCLFSTTSDCLHHLSCYFLANKLSLSIEKTCYSVFGVHQKDPSALNTTSLELKINGQIIKRVEFCKYLGVYIDSKLTWLEHIDYLYKKLIKFTSIFYKIRTKLHTNVLRMLYFSFL